jgi:DNA (cytosine-5)-methyltransferase 1
MRLKTKKFGVKIQDGQSTIDLDRDPAPAVMAGGIHGVAHGQYWLEGEPDRVNIAATAAKGRGRARRSPGKPTYRVPLVSEIAKLPQNGLRVVSTFSGCGGSCLGYRMAGFRVVWANEFVPVAGDSYEANSSGSILDRRDIRNVKPADVLSATGIKKGELDVLDGSPPCQAFSTAGKRAKGWGKERGYEHGARQKNEDLFYEYIRLLRGLMPRAFVAENVSGLVKGVAKGYFIDILQKLRGCGYRVGVRLLDAQWLGVPQARQRVIFVGFRDDLGIDPVFPKPLPYRYSVLDAVPWLGAQVVECKAHGYFPGDKVDLGVDPSPTICAGGISGGFEMIVGNDKFEPKWGKPNKPSPIIMAGGAHGGSGEIRSIVLDDGYAKNKSKRKQVDEPMPIIRSGRSVSIERRRFTIAELKRICSFPDDFDVRGTYAQQWAQFGNAVPPVMMFHIARELAAALNGQAHKD